jgi:hypothetical protein
MELLESHVVHYRGQPRHLKLYRGDLADIPPSEAVDLLVVSAFPDDYVPTPSSLIGALYRKGISVDELAADKAVDLRSSCSCWLSRELTDFPDAGFRRILCFEPLIRGNPPEVVGDIFRALMPFVLEEPPIHSIALPIIASGDQQFDSELMLRSLVDAAVHWLAAGLPVETIKVVTYSYAEAARLRKLFRALTASPVATPSSEVKASKKSKERYDVFVSYSHSDGEEVATLVATMKAALPQIRIFQDKLELKIGDAWQMELDNALENCLKIICVYSPAYLSSKMCMEEFNMARLRHRESEEGVLLPLYLRTAQLPLYMRSLQYLDCREADQLRVKHSCAELVQQGAL